MSKFLCFTSAGILILRDEKISQFLTACFLHKKIGVTILAQIIRHCFLRHSIVSTSKRDDHSETPKQFACALQLPGYRYVLSKFKKMPNTATVANRYSAQHTRILSWDILRIMADFKAFS